MLRVYEASIETEMITQLEMGGISRKLLDSATAQFCLEIIANQGEPAPRLCNMEPPTILYADMVVRLFPNVSESSVL